MVEPASSFDSRVQIPILWNLIARPARRSPESAVLLAPGRTVLSYEQLARLVLECRAKLLEAGIAAADRLAIVLANGPDMAVALLAAMTAGAAAPLNPNYSDNEFDFYLNDLEPKAVLLQAGVNNPSRDVAKARRIPIIELCSDSEEEDGPFSLACPIVGPPGRDALPRPDDIALLLHTSGTTSRPKLVPLTQENLYFSALNIKEGLSLSPEDRCLNVMPFFHIHGLVAALLATLAAGGSLVCAPGFLAGDFFGWIRDFSPTWYTAVPTIHQAVLAGAAEVADTVVTSNLRFIRSCSAPLSPSLMGDLETRFRVPVVEAYGMTEASHQMACNPLPPFERKPGSVGPPTGVEMGILDKLGNFIAAGQTGEVAIRGKTVMSGYLKNPEANAAAFFNGWLRTGDLGHFDNDGYLCLDGRLKEIINRGGEKISPREVEDALITHPGIAQVVAFSVPDDRLGEDVAVAVIPKPGAQVDKNEIRAYAAGKMAYFKVPREVVFVDEIPKGPTGKYLRPGLAEKLGLSSGSHVPPERGKAGPVHFDRTNNTEKRVLQLMQKFLGRRGIGADDNFFEAGGDSIQAVALLAEVERHFEIQIPLASFIFKPTARHFSTLIVGGRPAPTVLVPIKQTGTRPPFFCVHPHDGRATLFYPLARHLDEAQPFYAFQTFSVEEMRPTPGGIEGMARRYVDAMRTLLPDGPFLIGGYCFGALVAFEMARILLSQQKSVTFLALIDSYAPGYPKPISRGQFQAAAFSILDRARHARPFLEYISRVPAGLRRQYFLNLARTQLSEWRYVGAKKTALRSYSPSLPGRENDMDWEYRPNSYSGPALILRPTREPIGFRKDRTMGWSRFIGGRLDIETIPGYHRSLIFRPHHRFLAEKLNSCLRATKLTA